jgi:hypothetical protein
MRDMKKTFTKTDARHCKAYVSVLKSHYDGLTSYRAKIQFCDAGVALFTQITEVERLYPNDVFEDALILLSENGSWLESRKRF